MQGKTADNYCLILKTTIMKTRILIVASLAMLLISCDMNIMWEPIPVDPLINDSIPNDTIPSDTIISEPVPNPDDIALARQLVGVWNAAPVNNNSHSIFFTEDGRLIDRGDMPQAPNLSLRYPTPRIFSYSIKDGKLIYNADTTSFRIENDVLTIDAFRISSKEICQIVLTKAYEVPAVPLCQESIDKLNNLYSSDTYHDIPGTNVYASDCFVDIDGSFMPKSFNIPEFNPNKHTLILARMLMYRRDGLNIQLYYNQDSGYYEVIGEGNYVLDGEKCAMPYGIFDIPYETFNFFTKGYPAYSPIIQTRAFIYTY